MEFKVGQLVNVASRTGPNENKPGGVGKVLTIEDDGLYTVKYMLGGKESGIEAKYIQTHEFENVRARVRRGSTDTNPPDSTLTDGPHAKSLKPTVVDENDVEISTERVEKPLKKSPRKVMPSPSRTPTKAKMTSKIIIEADPEDNERNHDSIETNVADVSSQLSVDEDNLKAFNQELRKLFGQEDQLDMSTALRILEDSAESLRMLQVLSEQNRIYLDHSSNSIWKM